MFNNQQTNQQNSGNDPFQRIANAEVTQRSSWIIPGVYPLLYVDSLKTINSRNGELLFIAEFDILESETEGRPKGTKMSWCVNFRHDSAPSNIKTFLSVLMDAEANEVTAEAARQAVSSDNPCRGRLIRAEASNTLTKSGNDFTVVNWRTIPEEMQNKAEELKSESFSTPF